MAEPQTHESTEEKVETVERTETTKPADATEQASNDDSRMSSVEPLSPVPGVGQPESEQRGTPATKDPAAFQGRDERPWYPRTGPREQPVEEKGFAFTG